MTNRQRERSPGDATPVIGIGTGTANLGPLTGLLTRIKREDVAVVVVFEAGPPPGALDTITRATRLPVELLEGEAPVTPGRVYVCPAEKELVLSEGTLRLSDPRGARRLPIDACFRSLAVERTSRTIGIVLSGTGTDGALGLEAIRAADGITLVQAPTSADDDLPRLALEAGSADFSGTTEELADELTRILSHPYLSRSAQAEGAVSGEALGRLFTLLRASFGHDLSLYKQGTILRRIERRMALRRAERLEDYVRVVHDDPAELTTLYRDLLIGVTSFFRDGEPFDALKETVFPTLLARRREELPVRVWVPGCSTGEEAYSIAMCLLEFLGEGGVEPPIQIFGTDVDDAAIERARRGIYPANIALDVSPARLHRFFVKKEGNYQVCRRVRDLLVFATQNVTKDPPYSRLDLISCRNLLIYLQQPLQRKVLRIFHYALNPGGCLLLGTSETTGDSTDLFSTVDRRNRIYAKRGALASAVSFDVRLEGAGRAPVQLPRPPRTPKPQVTVQQLADRKVLERFGPPGVVVNQGLEIIQFRGRTGPYLDPAPGAATLNVLKLARPEVAVELRGALQRCQHDGLPTVTKVMSVLGGGEPRRIQIDVTPIEVPEQASTCLLILFVPVDEPPTPPAAVGPVDPAGERRRSEELEHELLTTKQYLQSTIEELEATNEELQSANEELQSANEELQSTNEEIETSKEELQSTNEELTTVNDELQTRMEELSVSNDDLHNVLVSLDSPLVIVGTDLRLRRFSYAAGRLLDLAPADLGRPLSHLRSFIDVPDLERVVSTVIESVTPQALEVRGADRRAYELRISPYKSTDHLIRGALLSFVDVDGLRRHGGPDQAVQSLGRALVGDAPHAALILDPSMRVAWANEAFLRTFDQREDALLGRLLPNLGKPWSDARLRANLERTALEGIAFKDLRLSHPDAGGSPRDLVLSGSRVQLSSRDPATLGTPVLLLALHDGRRSS